MGSVLSMTQRHLMWWCFGTGLLLMAWAVISLREPAYWDPQTALDYAGSVVAQVGFVAVAVTLFVWRAVTPVQWSSVPLLGASIGFLLWALGNLLEEVLEVEAGVWAFFVGAALAHVMLLLAGVVAIVSPGRWRWSGLVLLGVLGSLLLEGIPLLTPIPWLVMALILWRGWLREPAPAPVA